MYKLILGALLLDFFAEPPSVGKITRSDKMRIQPAPAKLIKKKAGVYIIRGKKTVVYIGFGDDVYQKVNEHFDGTHQNQYNSKHEVEILLTSNVTEAELLYYGLTKMLKPIDSDEPLSSIKITQEIQDLLDQYSGMN